MAETAQLPATATALSPAGVAPSATGATLATWTRLPPRQTLTLAVVIAAALAAAIGAWLWAQTPDYRVLYSNLSDRDGGAIIAALGPLNVPYKVGEGGTVILVPAAQVHETRLRLASQGLPKGSIVGYELVDNQKFGATQFQNRNVRAVMKDGKVVSGRRLNEDTYTVQLIDEQERLVSLSKDEIREYTVAKAASMPSYKNTLTPSEVSDVVAYLLSLKGL